MEENFDEFLDDDNVTSKRESKFNIFDFQQKELLRWITLSNNYMFMREYPSTFDALKLIYSNIIGAFEQDRDDKDIVAVEKLIKDLEPLNQTHLTTNSAGHPRYEKKIIGNIVVDGTYLEKLEKLMQNLNICMAKKQLLFKMEKKGYSGAGGK